MNIQNYARMYGIFLLTIFFWQNYKKWFHQIVCHNQVHIISKKLHCSIYFNEILSILIFFLTLTTKFWHFLWPSICTLPHLGSSVIQYHLHASGLFISPKSIKYSLLEYKVIMTCNHKNSKNWKKRFHLLRTSVPIGV